MDRDPFEEYIKQCEPDKQYKGYAWSTAIGLQRVDGLEPSEYLIKTAIENIEGNISMEEAKKRIDSYYESKPNRDEEQRTEEADKVSNRIADILLEKSFSFSPSEYIGIHKNCFSEFINMQVKSGIITLLKKNGYLTVRLFYTVMLRNCAKLWNMILRRKRSLVIKVSQRTK